jgi:hypothetical protein
MEPHELKQSCLSEFLDPKPIFRWMSLVIMIVPQVLRRVESPLGDGERYFFSFRLGVITL